jgi:hypothetical protein
LKGGEEGIRVQPLKRKTEVPPGECGTNKPCAGAEEYAPVRNRLIEALALLILVLTLSGCTTGVKPATGTLPTTKPSPSQQISPQNASQHDLQSVGAFLSKYGLQVQGPPTRFAVQVPANWDVSLGAYPEGLYWGLANVYSRDAGLDLTPLKGSTVAAFVYSLAGGLPGTGEEARFHYPSNVVLLAKGQQVVGAWLTFNVTGIGPSVKRHDLREITGLTLEQWVEQEKYFSDPGANADLAKLSPTQVLSAFFEAIDKGDQVRANACLSPQALLDCLTMNLEPGNLQPGRLYNPGFGKNNSLVESIAQARPLFYGKAPGNQTSQTTAEIAVHLYIQWADAVFNTPGNVQTLFAIMEKDANGWKLDSLGTGP